MNSIKTLFDRELLFLEDARDQKDIFSRIGEILQKKSIVTEDFVDALIDRERNHPTGLDLKPVASGIPNAAIPHTDTEYCLSKCIVFVRLSTPIVFNNMIAPDQEIEVKYLFFIINNEKNSQTNVLSELMEMLTMVDNMKTLETLESENEIYQFLHRL